MQDRVKPVSEIGDTLLPSNCLDDETLAGYADGSLTVTGRAAVDEHVDRCHACRRLLAAVGASSDGGDAPLTPAPSGSSGQRLG